MTTTTDIVVKLWSLCHVLRDDGVTYNEYVTELTFLLFLKMLEETKKEDRLPKGYRWRELAKREGLDQLDYYKRLLLDLVSRTRRMRWSASSSLTPRPCFASRQISRRSPQISTSSTGSRPARKVSAISMKGSLRR